LGEDEDDLVDEVVSDLDEDFMDVTSPARTAASAMDTDGHNEPVEVADDEEDDAPVNKRPPARRSRAGPFLDDSDSDE
jgi:hypothetical protein